MEVLESSEAEVRFMTIFIYSAHLHLGTSQSVSLGLKFQDPGEEKLICQLSSATLKSITYPEFNIYIPEEEPGFIVMNQETIFGKEEPL